MTAPGYGFGPTGANATFTRPTASDPYHQQTWFKDATAPGKNDGTVLNAAWLNQWIGERIELARAVGSTLANNVGNDDFLMRVIRLLAIAEIEARAPTAQGISDMLDGLLGTSWRDSLSGAAAVVLIDTAIGSDWRDVTPATVDAAITAKIDALKGNVGSVLDTLEEIEDALGNDPNLAATLMTLISNEATTRGNADTALDARLDVLEADPVTQAYTDAADLLLATSVSDEATTRGNDDIALGVRIDTLTARQILPGTGLTGGGSFAADRTLNLANTAVTAGTYGGAAAVATFTVDAQGRLIAAGSTAISIAVTAVSGLAAIATSASASDLSAGTVPAARMPALTGDVTSVAGGVATTLAASGVTAGSYGSSSTVATFTVDAKGRLTAAGSTAISVAAAAVTGLGTMSLQNAIAVAITGGAIDGTPIGTTTRSTGKFTTVEASGNMATTAGKIGIGTIAPSYAIDARAMSDAFAFPVGSTAQRPAHAAGALRWSTSLADFEYSDGSAWIQLRSPQGVGTWF